MKSQDETEQGLGPHAQNIRSHLRHLASVVMQEGREAYQKQAQWQMFPNIRQIEIEIAFLDELIDMAQWMQQTAKREREQEG